MAQMIALFLLSALAHPIVASDIVIVGTGVSGLTTAFELIKSGVRGSSITLIEQRAVDGGRVRNVPVPGFPGKHVEVGGTWIGSTQYRVAALSNELGLTVENGDFFHTYTAMNGTLFGTGKFLNDDGDVCVPRHEPWPSAHVKGGCTEVVPALNAKQTDLLKRLRAMAAQVGVEQPWASPLAHLDNVTVLEWLQSEGLGDMAGWLNDLVAIPLSTDVSKLSMLFYLFFEASCPSLSDAGFKGGAQDYRFTKGSQHLPDLLRENITRAGARILWNTTVRHISNEASHVRVTIASSLGTKVNVSILEASQVVVAMGTGDAARLDYSGITPMRQQLHDQWIRNNDSLKFFLVYKNAFWRKPFAHDATPRAMPAISMLPAGTFEFFDYSDQSGVPGILAGFFQNTETPAFREHFLAGVVCLDSNLVGAKESCSHTGYIEQRWDLEHPSGGTANIVQYMGRGTLSSTGPAWRNPIGRLHWAGSDTAKMWMGYIDGAVESGVRAAKEVRDMLGTSSESLLV